MLGSVASSSRTPWLLVRFVYSLFLFHPFPLAILLVGYPLHGSPGFKMTDCALVLTFSLSITLRQNVTPNTIALYPALPWGPVKDLNLSVCFYKNTNKPRVFISQ